MTSLAKVVWQPKTKKESLCRETFGRVVIMPPRKMPGLLESLAADAKRRAKAAKAEAKAIAKLVVEEKVEEDAAVEDHLQLGDDNDASMPTNCIVLGLENACISVKTKTQFTIVAKNSKGIQRRSGGEAFFVAVRGTCKARVRLHDNEDGTVSARSRTQSPL